MKEEELPPRRIPALMTYLSPFRIIEKDNIREPWSVTLEQVNALDWDYVALHEVIGRLDVGLGPYPLVVTRDGAIALPPVPELRSDQVAVEYFNRCLAALLLGGIYCEAISRDGLELGSLIDWKYVRGDFRAGSAANQFHRHIRFKSASSFESIRLHEPRSVSLKELDAAMKIGLATLQRLEPMNGEFLLKGVTGLARRDWGTALANLWIVTEQLLQALWNREILKAAADADSSKARMHQLNDYRAWTIATRIEMLHQKGLFDLATLSEISKARKARNELAHRGKHPSEENALACYAGIRALIVVVLRDDSLPFLQLDLADHSLSDPFAPPKNEGRLEVKFWMEIPKLPGEEEIEKAEAQLRSKELPAASTESPIEYNET